MKLLLKTAFLSAISFILLTANLNTALAATPYLSAYTSGSGNVQVTVTGADRYSRIDLSYRPQGTSLWTLITNVGSTDGSGYFSQNVNIGYQGTQMDMYVTVNGQQSPTVNLGGGSCPYGGCGSGSISFSPSSLNLNAGQSQNVSIFENVLAYPTGGSYYNNYYISNNSNSSAVSASISGSTMYVNGNNAGSANITVCSYNSGSTCATLYVTVGGGYNAITFSQNSVTLNSGQSSTVSIYGGSGSYYVSGNTNSGAVSASISGNSLYLYGYGFGGSSTVTVCSSGNSNLCGSISVSVNTANNPITFSQSSVNLNYGQSTSISIYGGSSSSYYVANNSNPSSVSASVAGSVLNLYGSNTGTSTIQVCSSGLSYLCGYVYVTVSGGYTSQITFSPSSVNMNAGQSQNVTIYTSVSSSPSYLTPPPGYYISTNSNSNAVTASISGSTLSLYGRAQGTANITVCSSSVSQCGTLAVTVNSGAVTNNNVSIYDNFYSPANITVMPGTTISWRNNGSMSHTVTANNGAFNSGTIVPGGSYNLTLNTPGTYTYHCQFHPGMTGTITVSGVLGGSAFANGTLVNDNGTIYITYKNMKSGFANYPAFTGLGYKLSNVITSSTATLGNSGYVITTAGSAHPWGSWVNNGNTIYFAHEQGLIPISTLDIFLNNGGSLGMVVNANSYDMQRLILPIMTYNDSRLK